ncbi:interleukin-27 subunit alpha [Clinocottus analis]|uniref:interleukin-27 subunit alpha n=1 Tax=Clinocottus analis TaxID=304258 RepID=UPI0035BFCFFB
MTVCWWALILLCCVLDCVESSTPSPVLRRNKYNNSFRLTRSTRTRVQQLQRKYKEQQLGDKHFEDKGRQLKDLPSLSTDFYSWLNLTEWERLHAAFWDMQAYWKMLERKRKQLEMEEKELMANRAVGNTLPQSVWHIQLDLRDLMSHVSTQMSYMNSSWTKPTSLPPLNPQTRYKTEWHSRVEGYIILRDLDLYLTKLARDFLLLASKTHL